MAKAKTVVSKAEFAGILGVSRGRVSQMCAQGLPVLPDGRVHIAAGKEWYQANVSPRTKDEKAPAAPVVMTPKAAPPSFENIRQAVGLEIFERICSTETTTQFARVCRAVGCTPEAAYSLASWLGCACALANPGLDLDDLQPAPEPDWAQVLGQPIDREAVDNKFWLEIEPKLYPVAGSEQKEN